MGLGFRDIQKSFGAIKAVDGVSFVVAEGEGDHMSFGAANLQNRLGGAKAALAQARSTPSIRLLTSCAKGRVQVLLGQKDDARL